LLRAEEKKRYYKKLGGGGGRKVAGFSLVGVKEAKLRWLAAPLVRRAWSRQVAQGKG